LIEEIVRLRENGFTLKEIANHMDLSIGKVQYRLKKYQSKKSQFSSRKEIRAKKEEISTTYHIPSQYDVDTITALVHSPKAFYLYWSMSMDKQAMVEHHLRCNWADLPKVIKIYDVSDINFQGHNHHKAVEITVPEMTNNWFVKGVDANRTYVADFGTRTFDGSFFTILRSIPIETPRALHEAYIPRHQHAVSKWQHRESESPEWFENVSCYSYYEKIK
jgi:uncharacterized protein